MPSVDRKLLLIACMAALVSLTVFMPSVFFDFVNYDDPQYVYENPAIRVLDGTFIKEIFTTSYMGWRMPLVWLSYALDYRFWGLNPSGYHLTNILFHAVNVAMVVILADMIFRRVFGEAVSQKAYNHYAGALLSAGLFFGIHPVQVESVAWITERKNVLSTLFVLGAIISYLRYLQLGEIAAPVQQRVRPYLLSLCCLLLALMTKPVAVMVPVLLFVADCYPYNRFRRGEIAVALIEKIPFFATAALVAIVSITSASGEQILVPLSLFPLADRFVLSGNALFEYCSMLLLPLKIIVLYLIPIELPVSYTVKALAVLAVTLLLLSQTVKMPWLLAAWSCFILTLLPSLYLFVAGPTSVSPYLVYLPSVFPAITAAALLFALQTRLAGASRRFIRCIAPSMAVVLLLFFLVEQQLHLATWRNSETLWTRVLEVRPVGRAYYYRAAYYMDVGNYTAAVADFQQSVRLAEEAGHPEIYTLYAMLGEALSKAGRYEEAVAALSKAITLSPLTNFFYYRSLALRQLGRVHEADEDLRRAGSEQGPIVWQYLRNRDDLKPKSGR